MGSQFLKFLMVESCVLAVYAFFLISMFGEGRALGLTFKSLITPLICFLIGLIGTGIISLKNKREDSKNG
jgi:hypothetical protein